MNIKPLRVRVPLIGCVGLKSVKYSTILSNCAEFINEMGNYNAIARINVFLFFLLLLLLFFFFFFFFNEGGGGVINRGSKYQVLG